MEGYKISHAPFEILQRAGNVSPLSQSDLVSTQLYSYAQSSFSRLFNVYSSSSNMYFRSSFLVAPVVLFVAQSALAAVVTREPSALVSDTYEVARDLSASNGTSQLEGRQAAQIASAVIGGITQIIGGIQDGIKQDKLNRGEFTKNLVSQMHQQHPDFNWIVCHTKHTYKFDGQRGVDWDHRHQEFDIKVGGTIGYEIYNLKSGDFTRQGDGGYLNWAYIGNIKTTDQGGKHIVFNKP
ncbi:hypothetical protein HGRIS_004126 [Hohenbuehelia grisea]|uniref:DUF7888 domain-containing protein n=1 Tax=Hohenbuehelia grisea TaxID=104357 RepID=A0ABR3JHX4_9AGAR